MKEVIKVKNLYASYMKDNYVLRNITFNVPENTLYIVIGPNGSGKTTLFRTLVGILKPARGYVKVLEKDPYNDRSVKKVIGYLPEASRIYTSLSVQDNLMFFAKIYNVNNKKIKEILDLTGLTEYKNSISGSLSQGLRRRISLARALLHDPKILVLDEPFINLDLASLKIVRNLIRRLIEELKRTIILSTHRVEEIETLSYLVPKTKIRVLILRKGICMGVYTYEELWSRMKNVEVVIRFSPEYTSSVIEVLQVESIDVVEKYPGVIIIRANNMLRDVPKIVKSLSIIGVKVYEIKALRTPLEDVLELISN